MLDLIAWRRSFSPEDPSIQRSSRSPSQESKNDEKSNTLSPSGERTPLSSPSLEKIRSNFVEKDKEKSPKSLKPNSPPTSPKPERRSMGALSPPPTVFVGEDEIHLLFQIDDYQDLSSARTMSGLYSKDITVLQLLKRVAKKVGLQDEEATHYALSLERPSLIIKKKQRKELPLEATLREVKIKSGTTIFFGTSKNVITVNFLLEGEGDKSCSISMTEKFHSSVKVQKVIEKVIHKIESLGPLSDRDQNACALFIPTNKSRSGIFMERHKTLADYQLPEKATLMFKARKKEELILVIEIEEYKALQCARKVTSMFNLNITVQEALVKIARKGNVNVEDVSKYNLFLSDARKMEKDSYLRDYGLSNRDRLTFSRKTNQRAYERLDIGPENLTSLTTNNVVLLCERSSDSFKEQLSFESRDAESLFWNLSMEESLFSQLDEKLAHSSSSSSSSSKEGEDVFATTEEKGGSVAPPSTFYGRPEIATLFLKNRLNPSPIHFDAQSLSSTSSEELISSLVPLLTSSEEILRPVFERSPIHKASSETTNLLPTAQSKRRSISRSGTSRNLLEGLKLEKTGSFSVEEVKVEKAPASVTITLEVPEEERVNNVDNKVENVIIHSPEQQAKEETGGRKRRAAARGKRPGALPSKKPVEDNTSLCLVCIYQTPQKYFTLAVNRLCLVKDILNVVSSKVGREVSTLSLMEVNMSSGNERKLELKDKIVVVKEGWTGKPEEYRFIIHQQFLRLGLDRTQSSILLKNGNKTPVRNRSGEPHTMARANSPINRPSSSDTVRSKSNKTFSNYPQIPSKERRSSAESKENNLPFAVNAEKIATRRRRVNSNPTAIIIGGEGSTHNATEKTLTRSFGVAASADIRWIPASDLVKEAKISKGSYAKVYKGRYGKEQVAIKELIGILTPVQIAAFKVEMGILSAVRDKNLVKLYGASVSRDRLSMVIEYCPNGSLHAILNNADERFDWLGILSWTEQTVSGIWALHKHDPPLVHRDIKSLNLLLDSMYNIKICDFGLSRIGSSSNAQTLAEVRGTMAFCPPEIYGGAIYNDKSDIYSLGIVMWEMVTRMLKGAYETPYSEFPHITFDFQIITESYHNKLRPSIPEGCPQVLSSLIQQCWHSDPDKRPSCQGLVIQLRGIIEETEKDPNVLFQL